jgi:hypothetical protein
MTPSASAISSYMATALSGNNTWVSLGAAMPGELALLLVLLVPLSARRA